MRHKFKAGDVQKKNLSNARKWLTSKRSDYCYGFILAFSRTMKRLFHTYLHTYVHIYPCRSLSRWAPAWQHGGGGLRRCQEWPEVDHAKLDHLGHLLLGLHQGVTGITILEWRSSRTRRAARTSSRWKSTTPRSGWLWPKRLTIVFSRWEVQ